MVWCTFHLHTDMDLTIEDIAGMYVQQHRGRTHSSCSCSNCHSWSTPASVIFIPTGGDNRDVQGEASSRLRIVHANFY